MNERIKKLAEQSGFYFYDHHDIGGEDMGETIESDSWEAAEKFAELIARECLYEMENTSSGDLDFAIWKIKKDFGIE
jgi:hypothetical protein